MLLILAFFKKEWEINPIILIIKEGWASSETIVEGEFEVGAQYHFYMETLTAACAPTEDGMDVYCTTQDQDDAHRIISECLNLKKSQ